MKPLLYIAGPYSQPDPVQNTHDTIKFADTLLSDGVVTPVIPHLTLLWHQVSPKPYPTWIAYDLEILARCDALFRLPGLSSGADVEVAFASELHKPVFIASDTASILPTLLGVYNWASRL